jgi:hypothetical protein
MTKALSLEGQYDAAAGQQREVTMLSRALSFSTAVFLVTSAGAMAQTVASFVEDGADAEAALLEQGSCPRLAENQSEAAAGGSLAASARSLADPQSPGPQAAAPTQARPMAFEYSDGYRTRLKIHKYASYATLPLFIAQYAVGQKLYDGNVSDSTRSAHSVLAASTGVLFGVNTVTGVWNLSEGRKDPNHRTKRTVHGILMLVANAGFVATGIMAPDNEDEGGEGGGGGSASTHRSVALASMGVATVAYLMMLIGN